MIRYFRRTCVPPPGKTPVFYSGIVAGGHMLTLNVDRILVATADRGGDVKRFYLTFPDAKEAKVDEIPLLFAGSAWNRGVPGWFRGPYCHQLDGWYNGSHCDRFGVENY